MKRFVSLFVPMLLIVLVVACTPVPTATTIPPTAIPTHMPPTETLMRPTDAPMLPTNIAAHSVGTSIVSPTPIPTVGTLVPLSTPLPDMAAVLTDISGTVVNFKTFEPNLVDGGASLGYPDREAAYYGIYMSKALPIQRDGVTIFTAIDKISEYQRTGDIVTLVLVNGERITGVPLTASSFEGDSALGTISIPAQKVSTIKFNAEQIKRLLKGKPAIPGTGDMQFVVWPADFTSSANVTLSSGNAITLQNIGFIYREDYCDDHWIPCRPGFTWSLVDKMPLKYGDYSTELDIAKIKSMDFYARAVASDMPTPVADDADMNIVLQSGEKLNARFDNTVEHYGIAVLGATENGFVHIPLGAIKSIAFK
jgi:hypothetical protein